MVKCPFCHFENEDGALFCEQCKSDLAGVEPGAPSASSTPVAVAEAVSVSALAEPIPLMPEVMEPAPAPMAEAHPGMGNLEIPSAVAVPMAEAAPVPPMAEPMPPAPPHGPLTLSPSADEGEPITMEPVPAALAVTPSAPTVATSGVPTTPTAPATHPAMPAAPAHEAPTFPEGAQPRLLVLRGLKRNVEYPIYEGVNFIGRADEKPVDIDLEDQEPPDRIWSSRQHAVITFESDRMVIEDLNSSNGTFVNRTRIPPGQPKPLNVNDVVQIGTVQLKVIV